MTRRVIATVLGAAVYLAVLGSTDPWDAATAVAVTGASVTALRGHLFPGRRRRLSARSVVAFLPFTLATAGLMARGIWQVGAIILGIAPLRRPGIVSVPIGPRTPGGVAATGLALTLSPGEVLVDVDEERGVMLVHTIDASDPSAVRKRYEALYTRQREVFP